MIVNVTLCKENAVSDSVRYQLIIKQKDKTAGDYLNRTCNVCYCFEIPCQSDPCWLSIFDFFWDQRICTIFGTSDFGCRISNGQFQSLFSFLIRFLS